MAVKNISTEIQKVLEEVPDEILEDVLAYLKQIQESKDKIQTAKHLSQILKEDKELLERLAR